jgi:hypothetical protein
VGGAEVVRDAGEGQLDDVGSSQGARTSSEVSMLARSTFTRMSSGR